MKMEFSYKFLLFGITKRKKKIHYAKLWFVEYPTAEGTIFQRLNHAFVFKNNDYKYVCELFL